ncbi:MULTISPECIES: APC family permease [unclassified Pseudomonas]|uniref:APC family permease n=1 Tax=unclassified Pseudomonas TaxID=196821 RepID=UPI0025DB72E2|nr:MULTISPECIES: APC family permease [unclassified Pseudomonas]
MTDLKRTLSLSTLVIFGVGLMTPIIVLGTFGILAQSSGGHAPMAYLAALVAMFLTALSYAHMARAFPVSGSSYTYVRKALNPKLGFMTGWAILLDYLFLPMAIWLIGTAYLNSAYPDVPGYVWLLAFIVLTSAINIIGLKLATAVNIALLVIQILVLGVFIVLCVHYTLGDATKPLFSLAPFMSGGVQWPLIMSGAAIACYSYLGFDAVSTLTEETHNPERNMPRAILWVTIIGGLIFVGTSYIVQIAQPSLEFANVDAAAYEIARNIGGDLFVSIFLIGLILGQFTSGIAAQASGSRLLYVLGRDSALPKAFFGYLSPRFKTPVFCILLSAVVALLALNMDVTTSTSFINFGAFLTFILVNLSVIFHYWRAEKRRGLVAFVLYLLLPAAGMAADLWLMFSLDHKAVVLGLSWLAIGFVYLLFLTGGLRRQPPELAM